MTSNETQNFSSFQVKAVLQARARQNYSWEPPTDVSIIHRFWLQSKFNSEMQGNCDDRCHHAKVSTKFLYYSLCVCFPVASIFPYHI
jgi:hypothetical protein